MTGQELANALEDLGVDVSGWEVVTVRPEGKEKWPTQGWRLNGWTLTPGGKKGYANFGRGMENRESWLTSPDGLVAFYVEDVEELAETLLDLVQTA